MLQKDSKLVALKVRHRREALGLTLDEVAEATGLTRQTIARVEKGLPVNKKTLSAITTRLKLFADQFLLSPEQNEKFSVHRSQRTNWMVSIPKASYSRISEGEDRSHVQDPKERRRLGQLGFQPFFTAILESELPTGVLGQAMMELHRPSWIDSHYGEEFIYCLRGEVKMVVDGAECILQTGDSMSFDAWLPHSYAPANLLAPGEEAPLILLVVAERPHDKALRRAHFIKHPRTPADVQRQVNFLNHELEMNSSDETAEIP